MASEEDVPTVEIQNPDPRWEDPIFAGHMVKRGNKIHHWAKRYMVLTRGGDLWYFKNARARQPAPKRRRPVVRPRYCIKVERYPKPFFFKGVDANQRLEWVKFLSLAGGLHVEHEMEENRPFLRRVPEIARKDLSTWTAAQVQEWLGYQAFGKNQPFTAYEENFRGVSGKQIDSIQESQLMHMGITNLPHRKKIMRAIKEIRSRRIFNFAQHVVYNKVENMTRTFGKVKNANWKFLARSLSDPECMKETYLNPSILQDSLNRYIGAGEGGPAASHAAPQEYDSGDDVNLVDDEVSEISCRLRDQKKNNFKLPVKLVVTEMVHSSGYKTARRLLSPVINRLPSLRKEFGIFHTAIIVGPWYLEWTDSSLCIPRKLYSSMALVSADIDTTTLLKNTTIEQVSMKLARVICRWNTEMTYCNINMSRNPLHGNCQEFVEDIMASLEIALRKEGAFGQFLERMKRKGQCEMVFTPSKEFMDVFMLRVKEYKFEQHQELDDFVYSCAEKDEIALQMDFKEEHKLLKSFDRAFWLRHFKKPNIDKFKPAARGCPFDDPRKTKSYMTYT